MEGNKKSWQDETVEIPAEVNGEKTTANVRLEDLENTFQEVRFGCSERQRMELLKDPDLSEYLKLHDIQVLSVINNTLNGCYDYLILHRFSSDSESFGGTTLGNIFDKFDALLAEFQKMDSESLADFFLEMRDIVRRGKKKTNADPLHHGPESGDDAGGL